MKERDKTQTYTFYMPGEECYFFKYFHLIALAAMASFSILGVLYSEMSLAGSFLQAVIFVGPICFVYFMFSKRFASKVMLDFNAKKAHFSFTDARGTFERDFKEIKKVNFQYYLIFVLEDAKIMVKRPPNKKEIFQMLNAVFKVDRGYFAGV
ncbi:MAG: hypothetical protein KAK02_01540 [Desulfobulbaceae bacterium]|nr:hypothetical protein [Desulfobulbaceae bacterium]